MSLYEQILAPSVILWTSWRTAATNTSPTSSVPPTLTVRDNRLFEVRGAEKQLANVSERFASFQDTPRAERMWGDLKRRQLLANACVVQLPSENPNPNSSDKHHGEAFLHSGLFMNQRKWLLSFNTDCQGFDFPVFFKKPVALSEDFESMLKCMWWAHSENDYTLCHEDDNFFNVMLTIGRDVATKHIPQICFIKCDKTKPSDILDNSPIHGGTWMSMSDLPDINFSTNVVIQS